MEKSILKCLYWNIHGISSQIIGEKNNDPHFVTIIQDYDIIAISELHTKVSISIPGFHLKKQKFRPKKHRGPKIGGGIAVFVNQKVAKNFRIIPNENVDSIWIRTSLGLDREEDETRLGFFYCSPDRKGSNSIDVVSEEIEKFNNGKNTFIFGDFNARTKTLCENIIHDKHDDIFGLQVEMTSVPPSRNSEDLKLVNQRGHDFLDICKTNDLSIANGRCMGDLYGKYTCHQKRGSSVVDYLIAPFETLDKIREFQVGEYTPMLSDHCPTMATIQLDHELAHSKTVDIQLQDLPKKLHWSEENTEKYLEEIKSSTFKLEVESLLNQPESITTERISELMSKAAGMKAEDNHPNLPKRPKKSKRKNQPWFDDECLVLKKEISACGKTLRSAPYATCVREKIYCLKTTLRNKLRKNKKDFKTGIVNEMCENMSNGEKKKYWQQLKKLEGAKDTTKYIPDYTLINHFKVILQDDKIQLKYTDTNQSNDILNCEITEEELLTGSKVLKNGKGIGIDNLYNEMIKPMVDEYPKLFLKLFNDILASPQNITKNWLHSLVLALHKKGAKEDPDNYRGISLMSCLGKLFLTIINNRLTEFCLHKGILTPSQLGFVQGNRTSDPHIILHNLLQKYCHRANKRLYGCFVDFSKAFDSVPRDILLDKLKNHGIDGNIFNIIQTIYLEDTVSIKIGNQHSPPFKTNKGVRQGCVLSPLLFNIFLADLQPMLDSHGDNVRINQGTNISCLLWADDILMLSESEAGLQAKLDALGRYCDINKLSVNTKKTQCMIFNKTGRLLKKYKFKYQNSILECVREYKYLGFVVTPSGEVRTGLEDLRVRALKALGKMRSSLGILFRHNINNTIHLYNYLVKPILTYCSDYWGCLQPKNNPIEKIHLMFCKNLLGVRKQTNTEGVLQEIGMTPLAIFALKSVVRNWERIRQNNANSILIASNMEAHERNLPWTSNIRQIFSKNGMLLEYLQKLNETEEVRRGPIAEKLNRRLIDQFNQDSFGLINTRSRMKTLSLLKETPGKEPYLTEVTNSKHRIAMAQLRLSGHRLEIETGRYSDTTSEERLCTYCHYFGHRAIGDEIHFLLNCPMLENIRLKHLPQNLHNNPSDDTEKFKSRMSHNENNDLKQTAKFIHEAFKERDVQLDVLNTIHDLITSTENILSKNVPDPGDKIPVCGKNTKKNSNKNREVYEIKNISQNGLKITLKKI